MAVPHEVTLVAWSRDEVSGLYCTIDIVETSFANRVFFVDQFSKYDDIYGYSQHAPNTQINSDNIEIFC